MSTQLISIAPSLLTVGQHGPFESGVLAAGTLGWQLTLTKTVDWPANGDVMSLLIEQAPDGVNFVTDLSATLAGGAWLNRQGVVQLTSTINVNGWNDSIATRRVRATVTVLQACTVGAVLTAL